MSPSQKIKRLCKIIYRNGKPVVLTQVGYCKAHDIQAAYLQFIQKAIQFARSTSVTSQAIGSGNTGCRGHVERDIRRTC
ncbi:hypothetical protein [Bathymodiolus japonicus methanotrophic gill symbiont]|uniref:hypothetical protein n=1 Tax=Bathymodiolus japonicus methanotrophic gill symbiont TaxID=113269 RepID=UPI001C8E9A42|nr:hypothetical protein [Bathymodiolus japonicus methanotrophic gill symbiont]